MSVDSYENVAIVQANPSYTEIGMNCVTYNEPMVVLELQEVKSTTALPVAESG
jgi:hypothetical protein